MSQGLYTGTLMVGIDQVLFGGKAPWTLHHHHSDNETLTPKKDVQPIAYPKPDGVLTFDRLFFGCSSPNTNHNEDQPVAPHAEDPAVPDHREPGAIRRAGTAAIARRGCTRS